MNISKEQINDLTAVIKLSIEKSDYANRVEDVMKDYRKKVQMPGFRAGKVPASVVQKMYGKSILVDEINKLVSSNLSNYITDNKLNLLGEPLPSEKQTQIDFDTQEAFDFYFDIAEAPAFEAQLSKKDKLPYYGIEVTNDMLEQQMKMVTGRFGKNDPVEVVGEKSMVNGDFEQLGVEENAIRTENAVVSMTVFADEKAKSILLGAKVGDEVVFEPKTAFTSDNEISYVLKISQEEAAELSGEFKFVVKEITEYVDAELNQDMFNQLYGEGIVNSIDEFNDKVKEELVKTLTIESDYRFNLDAREQLTSKFKMDLPAEFLVRWIKATNRGDQNLTDEQIEKELPKFFEDLKWQLIKNKLIEDNSIKIEQADIIGTAKKAARMQFMQYGLSNIPEDYLESYAKDMLAKEEQRRQFAEGALNDKVLEYIKEAVKLEEKEVSRDEFNKLFDKN